MAKSQAREPSAGRRAAALLAVVAAWLVLAVAIYAGLWRVVYGFWPGW